MNTQREEQAPARAPRMRYPEQALAELKLEDPSTPVTVYMIRRLVSTGTIPSIQMAAAGCSIMTPCWSISRTLSPRKLSTSVAGSAG